MDRRRTFTARMCSALLGLWRDVRRGTPYRFRWLRIVECFRPLTMDDFAFQFRGRAKLERQLAQLQEDYELLRSSGWR